MEELDDADRAAAEVSCPHCGTPVPLAADRDPPELVCPACGGALIIPDLADQPPHESDEENVGQDSDAELSELRIRQISALRRGVYRSRSYCVVAVATLLVAAVQLIILLVQHVRHSGWQLRPVGYLVAAVAAILGAIHFLGKAIALTREVQKPALADPVEPPDFSTLSDGSQHLRHLEEM